VKNKKKNIKGKSGSLAKNKSKIYILFLILVPAVLYFRAINFNFTNFDDAILITSNYNIISNLDNVAKAFTVDAFFSHQTGFYRPLQTVSFMIDAQISGQNPWAYHLTNLILYILVVIVLFILLNKLGIKQEIALLLSLSYSVHPLLTSAVCWVPSRGDLFLTLFGLLSFVTFINYFLSKNTMYLVFHFICFLLSCLAKETAVVFPFLMILYFYMILKKERSWKEISPFLIIWCISFLIYFLLRINAITVNRPSSVSGIVAFIKNLPAIPITLGKIFLPLGLTTMPLFDDSSMIIGILAFIFIIVMITKYKIYKNPYLILGALWYLGFTLPPLYYRLRIAQFSTEYLEHRTLLPMIGIFIMVGIFLSTVLTKWSLWRTIKLFIPLLIFYSIIAYSHSNDYSDPITFFSAAIASNSDNAGAINSRGIEYLHSGNIQQALVDLDRAIKIYPYYSSPYYNKGLISHSEGDYIKGEYFFSQALKYDTLLPGANSLRYAILYNFAGEKIVLKKYDEAIALLNKALKESPADADIYNNLGFSYFSTSRYDSAIYAYSRAIEFQPNSAFYYTNRGGAEYSIKDFKSALSDYGRALTLDPNSPGSWYNTGNTKLELNDYEGAISDLSTAIRMNPQWADAYSHRGNAYSKLNKLSEAREDWAEAKKLGSKEIIDDK
jgi:tetratricopeptide (TPR) repeat protein